MKPASISCPARTLRGTGSPVRAEVSTKPFPLSTVPSSGTRSPGRTRISAPTATSSGRTSSSRPSGSHAGGVGTQVQEGADRAPAARHGESLHDLPDLEEEHDSHRLGRLTDRECSSGGDGHQEVFVEEFAVHNAPEGGGEDVPARGEERGAEDDMAQPGQRGFRDAAAEHDTGEQEEKSGRESRRLTTESEGGGRGCFHPCPVHSARCVRMDSRSDVT